MNMPGFTAEASLGGMSRRYLLAGTGGALAGGEGVVPQATPVPDWIMDFWNATGGGGGPGGIGGSGGGSYQTVQQCLAKAEDGYNECRHYCYYEFSDLGSYADKQLCVANCSSSYTAAKSNCYRV